MHSTIAYFFEKSGTYSLSEDSTQHAHGALEPFLVPPA